MDSRTELLPGLFILITRSRISGLFRTWWEKFKKIRDQEDNNNTIIDSATRNHNENITIIKNTVPQEEIVFPKINVSCSYQVAISISESKSQRKMI